MKRGIDSGLFSYCGRIGPKKVIELAVLFALVQVALISGSIAATSSCSFVGPGSCEDKINFYLEQSAQGNGYFMNYVYAISEDTAVKNYAHGSGSINNEALLTYQNMTRYDHPLYAGYNEFTQDCIQFKETNSMVYAPLKVSVGTGYYAANPLDYSSLLKEKTWAKNNRAGTSMHHEVEYAHALDKDLEINVKVNSTTDGNSRLGTTQMKINEDVTDGKTHFGILQSNSIYVKSTPFSAWKKPDIEIDEDYWGTYHIEKNMTLEVPYYMKKVTEDWLPCCFGGYLTMPDGYIGDAKLKSAKGIFDCTCYKALNQAQFPRVY